MVINLLIVSCYCYADEDEFWRQQLYPFSYSITSTNRHAAYIFMAVKTLRYFNSNPNMILREEIFFLGKIAKDILVFKAVSFTFIFFIPSPWHYRPVLVVCIPVLNSFCVIVRINRVQRILRQADMVFVQSSVIKQCLCQIQRFKRVKQTDFFPI